MVLSGSLLVVKDTRASRKFYEDVLGATVFLDLDDYIDFKDGFALIQESTWLDFLEKSEPDDIHYRNHAGELAFEEDDLDAFLDRLDRFPEVNILNTVREYPWGQRSLRFYDPDGHLLEVGESMKVVVKRYLKKGMSVLETQEKTMFPHSFIKECFTELESDTPTSAS